nr:MAG TPA: hypothetical protein [Caudoviricetes sp.]
MITNEPHPAMVSSRFFPMFCKLFLAFSVSKLISNLGIVLCHLLSIS